MKQLLLSAICLVMVGCASFSNKQPAPSLYEEIGGKETLSKVFGLAITRIYNDPEIGHYFKEVPKRHLRMQLVNQVCELIGGPCKYDGMTMEEAHKGHQISDREFNRLVEYVQGAMRDIGLSLQQENRILRKLAPLKKQIVYR